MAIKYGTSDVSAIKYGTNDVQKVIYNGTEVYSAGEGEYCTVSGLGSSSPSDVTFTKSSGFDNIVFESVTIAGDTFVKFPTMYRKINAITNNQITSFTIANAQIDADYKVYPCFLKEDGVTIMPYILIGVSCTNSSTECNSIASTTYGVNQSIHAGRVNARARGSGYQLMDWMIFKLWQDLIICKMETINTNSGSRIIVDTFGIYWGDNYIWIDGTTRGSNDTYMINYRPTLYINQPQSYSQGYKTLSYTFSGSSSQEIVALGYDSSNEFANYPSITTDNTSYNTYYCDAIVNSTSPNPMYASVGFNRAECGAFYYGFNTYWSESNRTVRLCYRPIRN